MPEVTEEAEFPRGIDDVWKLVGDFGGFIEAMGMPVKLEGDGIGQTRTLDMGAPMVERLEERDEAAKRLVYSIVSSPLPLRDYRSTMQLSDVGGTATKLVWSGTFEAGEGSSEEDAANIVRSVYQGGIGALKTHFGA